MLKWSKIMSNPTQAGEFFAKSNPSLCPLFEFTSQAKPSQEPSFCNTSQAGLAWLGLFLGDSIVVSNYRDGLLYSYFGLSGPDGLMVSDIICFQSLITIKLCPGLTWSHKVSWSLLLCLIILAI